MPTVFFDSSAVAKAYRTERGSDVVCALMDAADSQCLVSALTVVEFVSVFARWEGVPVLDPENP